MDQRYTRNDDIHRDLSIETIDEVIANLLSDMNQDFTDSSNTLDGVALRRLKETKSYEQTNSSTYHSQVVETTIFDCKNSVLNVSILVEITTITLIIGFEKYFGVLLM